MIITFLLTIFYSFILFLIGLLPVGVLPVGISTALIYIIGVVNSFNWFFPITDLFAVLFIALIFEAAVLLWHFINWVYRLIRG